MIKLTSKYDNKIEKCNIKAEIKNTCTYEHLYAIAYLVESIIKNDPFTPYEEIIKILNELFKENNLEMVDLKEEKKDGKRNNEPKTEI